MYAIHHRLLATINHRSIWSDCRSRFSKYISFSSSNSHDVIYSLPNSRYKFARLSPTLTSIRRLANGHRNFPLSSIFPSYERSAAICGENLFHGSVIAPGIPSHLNAPRTAAMISSLPLRIGYSRPGTGRGRTRRAKLMGPALVRIIQRAK